jgi:regulator of protease activity HflC (stomatin/prohibitin superfamily)
MGLVMHLVFAGLVLLIGLWTQSLAVMAAARFVAIGALIWLPLSMVLYQRHLAHQEHLESEQLRRERESAGQPVSGIFGERGELLIAQNRLRWMRRYLLPIFGLLTAATLIATSLLWWHWDLGAGISDRQVWGLPSNAAQSAAFLAGLAFLAFLLGRYATGLAKVGDAHLLRAGASYTMASAMILGGLSVVLACVHFEQPIPERIAAYVIRLAMLVIGAETVLNLVLDIYRPRKPGEEPRAAFDSRLLGLLSETTGLAQTIAEAFDYQFGIPISKTWFYQLLAKAVVPLIAFAIFATLALSMVVVIKPGEQAIIERWGRPVQDVAGEGEALSAGLYLKWPWPIERVYRYPVDQVQQIMLGVLQERYDQEVEAQKVVLWSQRLHWDVEEYNLLVAVPRSESERSLQEAMLADEAAEPTGRAVPVTLIQAAVAVQYRIRPDELRDYAYNYDEPGRVLQSAAYRELYEMAATLDVERILGLDREATAEQLRRRIQARANELRLGLDIVFVGILGIHPPQKVADAFEDVVRAEITMETNLQEARAEANTTLAEVVGDERLARRLAQQLARIEALRDQDGPDQDEIARLTAEAEALFYGRGKIIAAGREGQGAGVRGGAAQLVAEAQAWRQQKVNQVRAEVETFRQELKAYRQTPYLYTLRRYLETIQEAVADIQKVVIALPERPPAVWLIDDKPTGPGLGDITGIKNP